MKFELWHTIRTYDTDALRGHAMCLIRRSCLPCYVENLDIESMFIEVRRLMNFISDENVIAGLHVVEAYVFFVFFFVVASILLQSLLPDTYILDVKCSIVLLMQFRMRFIFSTKRRQQHPQ